MPVTKDLELPIKRLASEEIVLRREHDRIVTAKDAEIERLRALLVRYQVANYIPEDCDLYAETRAALDGHEQ